MSNVLKQIGIQQWRLRGVGSVEENSALLEEANVEQKISARQPVEEINTLESIEAIPNVSEGASFPSSSEAMQAPEETSSNVGFSGSLKQALDQSNQAKAGFDKANKPLNTDFQNNEGSKVAINNSPDVPPEELNNKTAVPLNLSELISSDSSDTTTPIDQSFNVEQESLIALDVPPLIEKKPTIEWGDLDDRIKTNEHCPSCGWGNAFLGSGNQQADWLFIVDAPNMRDIEAKSMFSGRAGQLFEAMLSAIGLDREQVYATSVFKCAPTDDLSANPQCESIVRQQIRLVAPQIIITFGEFAAQSIIKSNLALKDLRLNDHSSIASNTPIIPTYSPSQMLDDTSLKALVWQDLKKSLRLVSV